MPPSPFRAAEPFPAVGLAKLQATAALQDRVDAKYVVSHEAFAPLAERLLETHAVLEIDGCRAFRYRTTYFDTPELRIFRDHVQERRRHYKCRAREYVDSGLCTFEVKLKGPRGRTVKHRMAYDRARRDELSEPALAFPARVPGAVLRARYGRRAAAGPRGDATSPAGGRSSDPCSATSPCSARTRQRSRR